MKLIQPSRKSYRYNSDSLILFDFVSKFLKSNKSCSLLDVGCGCGVVGLLLKRDFKNIDLTLLDIQEENVSLSKKNSIINSLYANVIMCDFRVFKSQLRFDYIVSNPPFYSALSTTTSNFHKMVSRLDKYLPLDEFLKVANSHLKPNGEVIFCYDALRIGEIFVCLQKFKLTPKNVRFVHTVENKAANLILIRAKKSSNSGCEIMPPLILNINGTFSNEAFDIYKKSNLKGIA